MFCRNCGAPIPDGEKFCRNCGTQIVEEAAQAAVNTEPQAPVQQEAPQTQYNQEQPYQQAPAFDQNAYQQPQYDQYGQPYGGEQYEADIPEGTPGAKAKVSFKEAVILYFKNYINFEGRSVISEYWFVFLFQILVSLVIGIVGSPLGNTAIKVLSSLFSAATIIPSIAVGVRRLHDIGKSGWYLLIGLIPVIGTIIEIVWFCKASDADNQYGPAPRQ